MKHNILRMKKGISTALLVLMLGLVGMGKVYAVTIGDLTYFLDNSTMKATVTGHKNGTSATGNLIIPSFVTYSNRTYSVTAIREGAFENCWGLTGDLIIPNSVKTIGSSAFYNCYGFTGSLTIGNSVKKIESNAFRLCGFSGSLIIGNSVTTIKDGAFEGCSGFTGNLTIPNSVITIGDWAFAYCSGFTGSLTIPNSVTTLGKGAFYKCNGFTDNLTIGNSLTFIGFQAFQLCSGFLGNLTIGNSVSDIGELAFYNCSGFTSMNVLAANPPYFDGSAFGNVNHEMPVYVPHESVSSYQAASGWSTFTNIQSMYSHEIIVNSSPILGGSVGFGNKSMYGRNIYDFENGTQGWTFIKGTTGNSPNNWMHCTDYTPRDFTSEHGHNFSDGFMISESYISDSLSGNGTPVTPDNFLVSPRVVLGGSIRFWASNPNDDYGNEHFGVFVSTTNNNNANSFTAVQEWTLLTEAQKTGNTRTIFDGIWYEYSADLSAFYCEGYVAIRHYNCTSQWLLCIDDITITEACTNSGTFYTGQPCTVSATPNPGYQFVNWTENDTVVSSDACYSFTVTGDRTLVANFVYYDNVKEHECDGILMYPNPTNGQVKIEAEGIKHITISTMLGQVIYEGKASDNAFEYDFSKHGVGLYLIRIETSSGLAVRKISVVR